jgi:hypothetical protein
MRDVVIGGDAVHSSSDPAFTRKDLIHKYTSHVSYPGQQQTPVNGSASNPVNGFYSSSAPVSAGHHVQDSYGSSWT